MKNFSILPLENNYFSEIQTTIINRWLDGLSSEAKPIDVIGSYDNDLLNDANYVAQLCLNEVQNRLPEWGAYSALDSGKELRGFNHRLNNQSVYSLYLCQINWATSGPGFDWPESYYLHYLEGYNLLVLTVSQDSPDCYGYADLAVSAVHVPYLSNIQEAGKALLSCWWQSFLACAHEPWSGFYEAGYITESEAIEIRSNVWASLELMKNQA